MCDEINKICSETEATSTTTETNAAMTSPDPLRENRDILAEMECAVCTEYMHPPIPMCVGGHSFCERCFEKTVSCPTCRQPKGAPHNFTLERLHDKLAFPCRYQTDGCRHVDVGSRIRAHEDQCPFNSVRCPLYVINDCTWAGPRQKIVRHCKKRHPNNVFVTNQQKLTCSDFRGAQNKCNSYHIMFEVHEELFKCAWEVDFRSGQMRWCVFHMGAPELTGQFSFEVDIAGKLVLVGPCENLPLTQLESFSNATCVQSHVDMVTKFCTDNDLIYTIRIIDKSV